MSNDETFEDAVNPEKFAARDWGVLARALRGSRENKRMEIEGVASRIAEDSDSASMLSIAVKIEALENGWIRVKGEQFDDPSHCMPSSVLDPAPAYALAIVVAEIYGWDKGTVLHYLNTFAAGRSKRRTPAVVIDVVPGIDAFEALEPRVNENANDTEGAARIVAAASERGDDTIRPDSHWVTESQAQHDAEALQAAEAARKVQEEYEELHTRLVGLSHSFLGALDGLKALDVGRNHGRIQSAVTVVSQAFTDAVQALSFPENDLATRAHISATAWIGSDPGSTLVDASPLHRQGILSNVTAIPGQRKEGSE